MDYETLNKECMYLASASPELFTYNYGFMNDDVGSIDGRGAPFYKFGIKSLDDKWFYFVGFHDGGLSENVGFVDAFWVEIFEWFTHSGQIMSTLKETYKVKNVYNVFWLLSMQEIVKHKLAGDYHSKSIEDIILLSNSDLNMNSKIFILDYSDSYEVLSQFEGLSTEYIKIYTGSRVSRDMFSQNWMHVLKASGLI